MRLKYAFPALCLSTLVAFTSQAVHAQKIVPARPLIVEHVDDARLTTLAGNTRFEARPANDRGAVSADLAMPGMILVLRRPAERESAIEAFAESQQDHASANYHHWLTAEEQGEAFGPAQSDIDAASAWLENHGFRIDSVAKNRMTIAFSGTAGQVQAAFHTEIHNLSVKGESHIANMSDPKIPSALAAAVVGVEALHNFHPHTLHHVGAAVQRDSKTGKWRRISTPESKPSAAAPAAGTSGQRSVILPQFNTGGTSNGEAEIEDIAPYDFATIYNLLPLWNASTPVDGTGQKIAIVGTSDINPADVTTFRAAFGLPAYASATGSTPGLSIIHPNTAPGDCSTGANSCINELVENSLDVEWAGAIAKNASIILVASSSGAGGSYTADPVYISSNYIIEHNTAPIMNVSYGECELGLGSTANAAYNALWQTASIAGISVFVASGDEGSASCDGGYDTSTPYGAQFGLSVSGVASTPYNVAVGGTDLNWSWIDNGQTQYWNSSNASGTLSSAKGYMPEGPWNNSCANSELLASFNSQLGTKYDAAEMCNQIGIGNITSGGKSLGSLVDIVGGSGGKSSCTTTDGGDPTACTGGYAKPSWQAGVSGIPSDSKRDIPDLSFFAANGFSGSAYVICASVDNPCSYSADSEPGGEEVGGTSVSSPIMAGVQALINQKTGSSQGLPLKTFYGLAAKQTYANCKSETVTNSSSCVFNDIDTGTITVPCDEGSLNCNADKTTDTYGVLSGYDAGAAYDLATGLGSLNITNAVNGFSSAVAAAVQLSSSSLTFSSTQVGTTAATQMVTVTNNGTDALTISKISISGSGATSYSETDTCTTASVASGKTCTITVGFKPAATGTLTASISIADNGTGSPQSISLTGTGFTPAPAITLSPSSLSLSAAIGASASGSVKLTNSGTAALAISSIALSGTNASLFTADSSACAASLAVSASCTINITFSPTATGSASASLTVTDNAAGSPQSVSLSGTGTEPTGATFTLSAAAATVSAGSTATSAVTATGTNGYVGPSTVTLSSCTLATSPTGANTAANPTCSVTTAAVTFAAGASTGSGGVVTISATGTGAAARKQASNTTPVTPWSVGGTAAGAIAVAGLLFFLPGRARRFRSLLGAFLLIATIGVLSGCGGSSSGSGGSKGTTSGAYTFTVTGKDNVSNISVNTTLNLTVN